MSTIRNDDPTKINNVILFAPKKWNISEEVIEAEFTMKPARIRPSFPGTGR